jgi:hypothetical protein
MSWNQTQPYPAALAKLRRKAEKEAARKDRPTTLYPDKIKMAPIFQHRRMAEGRMAEDEAHVKELTRALKAQPEGGQRSLDPVLVMAIGADAFCIDGHHRLFAYSRAKVTHPVPVEWFEGTIEEAVTEAVIRNAKNRLAMNRDEKLNAAWKLTVLRPDMSKPEVARATTVAERTVSNMRAALKRLREIPQAVEDDFDGVIEGEPMTTDQLLSMTWAEAQRAGKEEPDRNEDWEEKLALKVAKRLTKEFGATQAAY